MSAVISGKVAAGRALIGLAAVAALAVAGVAQATCGMSAAPKATPGTWTAAPAPGGFLQAVYHPARLQPVSFPQGGDFNENAPIVGLWEFEVRASMDEGPFHMGDLLDWGLAVWHDDGTEMQFSAGRPYDAGDVCLGVWQQTGRSRFHLNHIALGKDLATGSNFDGLTNIRADVAVDRNGNHYSGNYQIIQYSGNPADGTEFDQTSVQYQFMATVSAVRVTPN